MPYSVIAYAIVSYIGTYVVITALVAAILSFAISTILRSAFTKKPNAGGSSPQDSAQNRLESVRQPMAPRQYIYGQIRVGGSLTFLGMSDDLAQGDFSYSVFTLAGHEASGIGEIWFNGEDALIGADSLPIGRFNNYAAVVRSLGDESGQPFPTLVAALPGKWTDAHRQTGCAKLMVVTRNVVSVFKNGLPNVSALVKGRACYDPRTDGQIFTRNAALCLSDYLTASFGVGADYSTEIDEDSLIAAANTCDERVSLAVATATFSAALAQGAFIVDLQSGTIGAPAGSFVPGVKVRVSTSGVLPTPLVAATDYYLVRYGLQIESFDAGTDAFYISATRDGVQIGLLDAGTGTHTLVEYAPERPFTIEAGKKSPLTGDGVRLTTTGVLPVGLSAGVTYYAVYGTKFGLATTIANALAGIEITIIDAGTGTHTLTYYDEARYNLDGAFLASAQPKEVLGSMLAAMAGKAVNVGGKWFIYAGVYDAPSITLDEGDLAGPIQVQNLVSRRDNANGIKGNFTDPSSSWQVVSFPALASDAYMEEDGGERVWKDIDLAAFVTSGTQAQRLAKIELLGLRQGLTVRAQFKLTAWAAMTGAAVALTNARFGWTAKAFEVMTSRFSVSGDGALGVELELRETAAAIFDWSTSEEQTVDIAPNTSLPDGNSIAAPGTPLVVEVIYETTGSGGAKSKAVITWAASTGPYVASYKVEYKLSADSAWTALALTQDTQVELFDATPGTYNFRVTAINQLGVLSEYSTTTTKELYGLTAAPADVTNFAVRVVSGMANCTMDKTTDLDVLLGGRLLLRHSPLTSGAIWNDCLPLAPDGWAGNSVSVNAPLMGGTYMAKFEDSTGHASLNAASFVVTEAHLTGFTTLVTVTESSAFSGVKTNVSVASLALQLSGGTGSPISDVSATGTYAFFSGIDLGSVLTVRLFPNIISASFDTFDLWDSDELLDSDELVDSGGDVNDVVCALEVRTTSSPTGSPTPPWGPWHTLPGQADYTARGFEFRLQFESGSVTHNRAVTTLSVAAKQPT